MARSGGVSANQAAQLVEEGELVRELRVQRRVGQVAAGRDVEVVDDGPGGQPRRHMTGIAARAEVAMGGPRAAGARGWRRRCSPSRRGRRRGGSRGRRSGVERQQLDRRLGLLEAQQVRRLLAQEALDEVGAQAQRVDVPGGDAEGHARASYRRRRRPQPRKRGPCPRRPDAPSGERWPFRSRSPTRPPFPVRSPPRPTSSSSAAASSASAPRSFSAAAASPSCWSRRAASPPSSPRATGAGVRQQGRDPAELPLMVEARRLWQQLAAEIAAATGADIGLVEGGVAYLARGARDMAAFADWLPHATALGIDTRLLDAARGGRAPPRRVAALRRRPGHALRHARRALGRRARPRRARRPRGRDHRRGLRRPPPRPRRRPGHRGRHRGRPRRRLVRRPRRRRLVGAVPACPWRRPAAALGPRHRRRDRAAARGVERRCRRRPHRLPPAAGRRLHHRRRRVARPLHRARRLPRAAEVPARSSAPIPSAPASASPRPPAGPTPGARREPGRPTPRAPSSGCASSPRRPMPPLSSAPAAASRRCIQGSARCASAPPGPA